MNNKKVFLIWAAKFSEISPLISELQNNNCEILYWVGLEEAGFDVKSKMPSTIFHEHLKAWSGVPAKEFKQSDFPPPGKELIEKMYKTESLVLTMMNKKYDDKCVDERRHIYYNMLGYWYGIINKLKPEAIIFPVFPHTVYNFIIFNLAKQLNIKTVMFDVPWVSDRILKYRDFFEGSLELQSKLKENAGRELSIENIAPDLRDYFEDQKENKIDPTPVYTKRFKEKFYGPKNAIKIKFNLAVRSIKDGFFLKKIIPYILKTFKPNLKKDYESLEEKPKKGEKFIYVPLCFQPEASSSPLGDMFVDQILMIETISSVMPEDWFIYVKEHPAQWWLRSAVSYSSNRYRSYYQRIKNIKNTRLIPIETDTYELIKESQAVAVVTGTAGWESLLRGKPALVFGYPWYRDFPNLFRVNSPETCFSAIEKIKNGFTVQKKDIINYLYCLGEASFHGYFEIIAGTKPRLTREESLKNISKEILSSLSE